MTAFTYVYNQTNWNERTPDKDVMHKNTEHESERALAQSERRSIMFVLLVVYSTCIVWAPPEPPTATPTTHQWKELRLPHPHNMHEPTFAWLSISFIKKPSSFYSNIFTMNIIFCVAFKKLTLLVVFYWTFMFLITSNMLKHEFTRIRLHRTALRLLMLDCNCIPRAICICIRIFLENNLYMHPSLTNEQFLFQNSFVRREKMEIK